MPAENRSIVPTLHRAGHTRRAMFGYGKHR